MGEAFGVRTAWHGPGDVSPIGHMANVTLDVVCYNFGIQEYSPFNDRLQEVFKGCPTMKDGYVGERVARLGIEVDESWRRSIPTRSARTGDERRNERLGRGAERDGTIIKQ